jgi:hypothetical protein
VHCHGLEAMIECGGPASTQDSYYICMCCIALAIDSQQAKCSKMKVVEDKLQHRIDSMKVDGDTWLGRSAWIVGSS